MPLDPDDLRRYAARDWGAPERVSRAHHEAMRRAVPGWPDEATRLADLAHHARLRRLLERARHVGARPRAPFEAALRDQER